VDLKNLTFWDIIPCIPLKINAHFGGICRHMKQVLSRALRHASFLLGLLFGAEYEGDLSSKTLVDFHRTTGHYIP
jgi:hypothetical protein